MKTESKPFYRSLTFWGLLLAGAGQAAEVTGAVPPGSTAAAVQAVTTLTGLVLALLGRTRADKPLSLG